MRRIIAVFSIAVPCLLRAQQDVTLPFGNVVVAHMNQTVRLREGLIDSINVALALMPKTTVRKVTGITVASRLKTETKFSSVTVTAEVVCSDGSAATASLRLSDRTWILSDTLIRVILDQRYHVAGVDQALEYESSSAKARGMMILLANSLVYRACDKPENRNLRLVLLVFATEGGEYATSAWKPIGDDSLWKEVE